jgi:hypothetical protein
MNIHQKFRQQHNEGAACSEIIPGDRCKRCSSNAIGTSRNECISSSYKIIYRICAELCYSDFVKNELNGKFLTEGEAIEFVEQIDDYFMILFLNERELENFKFQYQCMYDIYSDIYRIDFEQ